MSALYGMVVAYLKRQFETLSEDLIKIERP